jgi:hypothetical protein
VLQRAIVDVFVANEQKSMIIGADQMRSKFMYTFSCKRSNRSEEFLLSSFSNGGILLWLCRMGMA